MALNLTDEQRKLILARDGAIADMRRALQDLKEEYDKRSLEVREGYLKEVAEIEAQMTASGLSLEAFYDGRLGGGG